MQIRRGVRLHNVHYCPLADNDFYKYDRRNWRVVRAGEYMPARATSGEVYAYIICIIAYSPIMAFLNMIAGIGE